jgi:hypothetical protein
MKEMQHKGYDLFNEVVDSNVRNWNRTVTMHNMCADGNQASVRGYIEQLDQKSRLGCVVLLTAIKRDGIQKVKETVIKEHQEEEAL